MDAFIKAVKSPIHRPFSLSSKHKKLPDKWGDYQHQDKIWDGITFHVKYLGNTLVTELDEEGQSYGDSISADAVKTIVAMAKASGKKLPKMSILVSPFGICVTNTETHQILSDLDIYRICFCTADRDHPKVFAYIARNRENETMECQAFLCSKRKIAEAVTLTVAESFKMAQDKWEEEEQKHAKEKQQSHAIQSTINSKSTTTHRVEVEVKSRKEESILGFEDNFSDLPVMSSSNLPSGSTSGFSTNFLDSDRNARKSSHAFSTSFNHDAVNREPVCNNREPVCNSPSADDLLSL